VSDMGEKKRFYTIEDADRLGAFAHGGVTDKRGSDYMEHPRRVAAQTEWQGGAPYLIIAAKLHDTLEDSVLTAQQLLDFGFHSDAVDVVELLTRGPHTGPCSPVGPLCSGCLKYYADIKEHPGARLVKLCDIDDNTQEWRLGYLPPKVQVKLRAKYALARELLS